MSGCNNKGGMREPTRETTTKDTFILDEQIRQGWKMMHYASGSKTSEIMWSQVIFWDYNKPKLGLIKKKVGINTDNNCILLNNDETGTKPGLNRAKPWTTSI